MRSKRKAKPKTIRIGKKTFNVVHVDALSVKRDAEIDYRAKEIRIVNKFWRADELEALWHEIVHGILRDMRRHDLNNEAFVNAFCKRLYRALEDMGHITY